VPRPVMMELPTNLSSSRGIVTANRTRIMIVAFRTEKLRAICEDPAIAAKELGSETAVHLRGRLADVLAATATGDLLVGNPRFAGDVGEYLIIDLGDMGTMTWTPNHVTSRTTPDGDTDWARVTRVQLLRIEVKR